MQTKHFILALRRRFNPSYIQHLIAGLQVCCEQSVRTQVPRMPCIHNRSHIGVLQVRLEWLYYIILFCDN